VTRRKRVIDVAQLIDTQTSHVTWRNRVPQPHRPCLFLSTILANFTRPPPRRLLAASTRLTARSGVGPPPLEGWFIGFRQSRGPDGRRRRCAAAESRLLARQQSLGGRVPLWWIAAARLLAHPAPQTPMHAVVSAPRRIRARSWVGCGSSLKELMQLSKSTTLQMTLNRKWLTVTNRAPSCPYQRQD